MVGLCGAPYGSMRCAVGGAWRPSLVDPTALLALRQWGWPSLEVGGLSPHLVLRHVVGAFVACGGVLGPRVGGGSPHTGPRLEFSSGTAPTGAVLFQQWCSRLARGAACGEPALRVTARPGSFTGGGAVRPTHPRSRPRMRHEPKGCPYSNLYWRT